MSDRQRHVSKDGNGDTISEKLVYLAADKVRLFLTPDDVVWAAIDQDGHKEIYPIASRSFRRWLINQYYSKFCKVPKQDTIQHVIQTLEAQGHYGGNWEDVFLRTADRGDKLYLDLANEEWQCVETSQDGWRVIENPPLYFRRQRGMLPISSPKTGGDIRELGQFVNVESEEDFLLIVAWLAATLRSKGPYPILALAGEPGSAKSTTARTLRSLIDPNASPLRSSPKDERDCWIAASNSAVLVFDNLSNIPLWLSDTLCRIATGGGYATRQLHTDDEEILFAATRPIIITAVGDVIAQSDLADRAIMIELPEIPDNKRRDEASLSAALANARPRLLGALLDIAAHGMAHYHETELEESPRMADFAKWAAACEGAFAPSGSILKALKRNLHEAVDNVIAGDAVCVALLAFLEANHGSWKGRPSELLNLLPNYVPLGAASDRKWPRLPQTLSNRLRMAKPSLRKRGVMVDFSRAGGHRYFVITRNESASDRAG